MRHFYFDENGKCGSFNHPDSGFCRYSTHERRMIPHFDKILSDRPVTVTIYSQARKTHEQNNRADLLFFDTACGTATWVIPEMRPADGGYHFAQGTDPEGSEGNFCWPKDDINSLISNPAASRREIRPSEIK